MKPRMLPKQPHPLYPPQDARALGRHYTDHVQGMTEAGLDGKAEIAEQLAWRDKRIAERREQVEMALLWRDALQECADMLGMQVGASLTDVPKVLARVLESQKPATPAPDKA